MYCNNYICGKKFKIIINLGAFINIINKTIFCKLQITDQLKKNFYGFIAVDRLKIFRQKIINKEIKLLSVRIQQNNKYIIFDIVDMVNHQIVLKIPWLEEYNLKINWKIYSFEFDGCKYIIIFKPQHWQNLTGNEQWDLYLIKKTKTGELMEVSIWQPNPTNIK